MEYFDTDYSEIINKNVKIQILVFLIFINRNKKLL